MAITSLAFSLLFVGAPGRAQSPEASIRAMTLEQAITAARSHSPTVVGARGNVSVAEVSRRRSLAAYAPTLGLSASSAYDPAPTTSASLTAGLGASWDVFTGFRRSAERDRAQAQLGGARAELVDRERSAALDVTGVFFAALSADQLLGVASSRLERAEAGFKAAQRRAELGSATRSDVLRAQLEVNAARTQSLQAETTVRETRLALGRLVGVPGPVRPEVETQPPAVPTPSAFTDAELDSLVETHPAVLAAEASTRASEASIRAARSGYWPSLGLSAGYDWYTHWQNGERAFATPQSGWGVRMGLTFPLWDGFARDEALERARVASTTSRAAADELRRTVRASLQNAVDRLRLASEQVRVADESVAAAREDLRVQQSRYALGATTILDLLRSQETVVDAETDAVSARFDQGLARAELEALTGRPMR